MIKPENCVVTTISVKRLVAAIDIKHIFKGYTRIAYEIFTLEETLKYGESADEADAERVYRQIAQFPGWPTEASQEAAGRDILEVLKKRPWLTKDDIGIRVWNISDKECQNIYDPHKETRDVEQELIRRHIEQYDRAPIGNKVEQRRHAKGQIATKTKTTVASGLIDQLFESE
jgi:hypothetical protein